MNDRGTPAAEDSACNELPAEAHAASGTGRASKYGLNERELAGLKRADNGLEP